MTPVRVALRSRSVLLTADWFQNEQIEGILMATLEIGFLQGQLEERKQRLEVAIASELRKCPPTLQVGRHLVKGI